MSVILNNLISNSIKYYDPKKTQPFININIVITKIKTTIEFEDNGIGIEERYLNKVFDMFFRGTEQNKGAGLGLYIVKEAVEKLNGKINVYSQVGVGTIFKMELPNNWSPHREISNENMEAVLNTSISQ